MRELFLRKKKSYAKIFQSTVDEADTCSMQIDSVQFWQLVHSFDGWVSTVNSSLSMVLHCHVIVTMATTSGELYGDLL